MHKIQIDNFIFHVNVTDYCPAIPGSFDKNAASDWDYYGVPEELSWECDMVTELHNGDSHPHFLSATYGGDEAYEIVDAYAEQITERLLAIIHFEQECAEEIYV